MDGNWNAVMIGALFTSPFLVIILTFLYLHIKEMPPKEDKPLKKTFLEEAFEADVERPRSNKAYNWAEFQRDLHDDALTFNEIHEKYGGVFPKKPVVPK